MERFGIQEANGTAYSELTRKLFIRCVKQFKKGLFKSYNFFLYSVGLLSRFQCVVTYAFPVFRRRAVLFNSSVRNQLPVSD